MGSGGDVQAVAVTFDRVHLHAEAQHDADVLQPTGDPRRRILTQPAGVRGRFVGHQRHRMATTPHPGVSWFASRALACKHYYNEEEAYDHTQ